MVLATVTALDLAILVLLTAPIKTHAQKRSLSVMGIVLENVLAIVRGSALVTVSEEI